MSERYKSPKKSPTEWFDGFESREHQPGCPPYGSWVRREMRAAIRKYKNAELRIVKYDTHRTTSGIKKSETQKQTSEDGLVLSFLDPRMEEEIAYHCNIDRRQQRSSKSGVQRGTKWPAGIMGRFYPHERTKFRKFWLSAFGGGPSSWGAAHRELAARMRNCKFAAVVVEARKSNGEAYLKAVAMIRIS